MNKKTRIVPPEDEPSKTEQDVTNTTDSDQAVTEVREDKDGNDEPQFEAASKASLQTRHWALMSSFLVVVVAPLVVMAYYLYTYAADQYVSNVGFSVRSEEMESPLDLLGGLGVASSGSASDSDILYEFMQSQIMVETVDADVDLRTLYSKPDNDPVFSFKPDGSIEDLVSYWRRMVRVNYDSSKGLIELEVRAFAPEDAKQIAEAIFRENTLMINELSALSREDATRYAREERDRAIVRLKEAREAMTQFRHENKIADPSNEIVVQSGLMTALQQSLSNAFIELDLLEDVGNDNDPRVSQAKRKIAVIESRIQEEREKYGQSISAEGGVELSRLIGEYESLLVDREFAEKTYLAALQGYDVAVLDARRQSKYLAAYIKPTMAESPQHPKRAMILGLSAMFLVLIWTIGCLIFYAVRDRR
ncbi:sugar transporter [Falsihalocynthiibacter sp. SS001]|uniref:sugar transporter n=1 Tax=Falsihalocynthiibacter sp. SS001 TaxID=3349698 RepID=UPI0036D37BEA